MMIVSPAALAASRDQEPDAHKRHAMRKGSVGKDVRLSLRKPAQNAALQSATIYRFRRPSPVGRPRPGSTLRPARASRTAAAPARACTSLAREQRCTSRCSETDPAAMQATHWCQDEPFSTRGTQQRDDDQPPAGNLPGVAEHRRGCTLSITAAGLPPTARRRVDTQ